MPIPSQGVGYLSVCNHHRNVINITMKTKTLIFALSLAATSAFAQGTQTSDFRSNMDLSVRPGNDFYQYAAGQWLKTHPLDAEHSMNGAFVDLDELNQKRINEIVTEHASAPQAKGSLGQKIGSLYRLAMDSVRRNREGAAPIRPILTQIAAIKDRREYQIVTAKLSYIGVGVTMFDIGVGTDLRESQSHIVGVSQGGLGLGERDYYLNDDEQTVKVRNAYLTLLKRLLTLAGNSDADAQRKVDATMAIETRIAKQSYDQVKLRDISANYHKMTYTELVTQFPGVDWGNLFLMCGYPAFQYVDVGQPEPIHEVEKILADTPLDDLKAYAEAHALLGATGTLDDEFRRASFEFNQVVSGVKQDRPRWKRATSLVSSVLSEAIGKLYVEKYFPESSKERMLTLVHNLQEALAQRIDEATWMGAETKAQAKDKLQHFIIKIGYPDKWRDYTGLQIDDSLSLYENMRRVSAFMNQDDVDRHVNKPVDKTEWEMSPQTVNAYYNPTTNEICFPAAILQPPFFDPQADDAINYGAIGGVIGHEMSHGFDDQGCQFDKEGNQKNWWTDADKKNYDARTKILADHFSSLEILPGKKINGLQTLGENIGDNGGLNIAYRALQNSMKTSPLKTIDGFTPEQRFFLSWGRVWASNASDEVVDYLMKTDVHSPNKARVNGALPMVDAWYTAFGVKKSDKLFVPKAKRAHIW